MSSSAEPASSRSLQEATIDDDDDAWEALEITPSMATADTAGAVPSSRALQVSNKPTTVQTLQRRVETRRTLQKGLVEHPLHIFWSHFLYHLVHEFWKVDLRIRCAVLCLVVGAASKIFMMMTWHLWYPKTIFMLLIIICSWIYLNADDIPRRIEFFIERFVTFPNRFLEILENLDTKQARKVMLVLFFVPTMLQTRTILVLVDINSGGGFLWTALIASCLTGVAVYLLHNPKLRTTRNISHICLVILYGAALCISLFHFKILSLPRLAAPFFLSTGTLLLSWDENDSMEWLSALVRSALRLTLRDVLASINNSVQEDEMLQLAMLRWLVDYWSYTPPKHQSSNSATNESQSTTDSSSNEPMPELQWDELYPMLETAADQMATEANALQGNGPSPSSTGYAQQSPSHASSEIGESPTTGSDSSPMQGLHSMLASMDVDERAKPAVEAYKRHVEELPPTRETALLVSLLRRCPASFALVWELMAFCVFQSLADSLMTALLIAPLVVVEGLRIRSWLHACDTLSRILGSINLSQASDRDSQKSTTNEANTSSLPLLTNLLPHVDPMVILLSGDDDVAKEHVASDSTEDMTAVTTEVKIPNLLMVWRNIQSSVSALETSLTAARAVQTGAIAMEFAHNLMSLTSMCSEASQQGWALGLAQLIAKEVVFHHQGDISTAPRETETTFTYTAVNAFRNGQLVAHHLGVLAEEDGRVGQIVAPIVGFFGFVGSFFDNNKKTTSEGVADNEGAEGPQRTSSQAESSIGTDEVHLLDRDDHAPSSNTPLQDDLDGEWEAKTEKNNSNSRIPSDADKLSNDIDHSHDTPASVPHEENIESEASTKEKQDRPLGVSDDSTVNKNDAALCLKDHLPTSPTAALQKESSSTDAKKQDYLGGAAPALSETILATASLDASTEKNPPTIVAVESLSSTGEAKAETKLSGEQLASAENSGIKQATVDQNEDAAKGLQGTATSDELAAVMDLIAEAFEKSLIDEPEKNEFFMKLSTSGSNIEFLTGMKKTLHGLLQEEGFEPLTPEHSERASHVAAAPDSGWSPAVATAESEEQAAIQPLDYSERLASAVQTRQALVPAQLRSEEDATGIPTVESSTPAQAQTDDEDDNMWVKVGGGIAVLGAAVIGGAFVAMQQDNPNNSRENNENNRSSVVIEQLDDEEETGNEWENTAANQQAQ